MKKRLKRVLLFIVSAALIVVPAPNFSLIAEAADYKIGDNELRGVWIASVFNIDFPSKPGLSAAQLKAELDDIVKVSKEAGLNTIFFQVRPTSDALYDSGIFPTSHWLTGTQGERFAGGFDPLAYIIEKAHANNIELHAWVNPYRITQGSAASPQHDLNALARNNPARRNPDWVIKYDDGRMYYNPGLPAVRDLILQGVLEIINKYDVDGIHFDDYFYPSPITGAHFDDDAAFARYGGDKSRDEWRCENVNTLVKSVYDAVKKAKPEVRFGISPTGIWANDNSNPAGSATRGFQHRYALHADSRAWVEGGYIDYLLPQIYWAFNTQVAPFDVLTRWWSSLLDGTGVDLYIGHAVYKLSQPGEANFKNSLEIPRQVEYARQYMGVRGSAFYGYKDLRDNLYEVKDRLAKLFAEPRSVPKPVDDKSGIVIGRPVNNATVSTAGVNIRGGSNPAFPVYFNNQKVTRTKGGFFNIYVPLANGRNTLVFTQNNKSVTHIVTRGSANTSPSEQIYPQMDGYKIEMLSPRANVVTTPGDRIQIRVQAPSGSTVTATLGGASVTLEPLTNPPDEGRFMAEVYSGTITLPATRPIGTMLDLNAINFTATRGSESASLTGITVKLVNSTVNGLACEVTRDFASLKISPASSWVNDYTPAAVGMRDRITGFENGHFKLSFGGFISANDVILIPEKQLLTNRIISAAMENTGDYTEIRFAVTENVPVNARCKDGVFNVTLYNTPDGGRRLELADNPMFNKVSQRNDASAQSVTYSFDLVHPDNFYGFEVVYGNGFIIVKVKNPMRRAEGDKPLAGLRIGVDAGHGGSDPGAMGFLGIHGKNEADLALDVALELRDILKNMGAEVVMTRESDVRVELGDRPFIMNDAGIDLGVSVHYNSMTDAQDNTLIRSVLPLYSNESGRLLAKSVGRGLASEINRFLRDTRFMELGVARSHKYPVALIEIAFITNPDEYEFAVSEEGVWRSAQGIANGIIEWLDAQAQFIK